MRIENENLPLCFGQSKRQIYQFKTIPFEHTVTEILKKTLVMSAFSTLDSRAEAGSEKEKSTTETG